jgi:hypothetical protein
MEKKYRLEFNEAQQSFHLDNYTHTEGKHGWFTIFEYCTDLEFKVYESFVNRKLEKKKLTKEYLLKKKKKSCVLKYGKVNILIYLTKCFKCLKIL